MTGDTAKTKSSSASEDTVIDESENDPIVAPVPYDITSYGADIDAEGFVNRLDREDVYIPPFQRDYVWSQREASRFIESLLLGLPVPGVFLAKERDSARLLVIDGQQRLKSLHFFFKGFFNPQKEASRQTVFDLKHVQDQFLGKTFEKLTDDQRITLRNSIIHATIVKQDAPEGDQSSIYHIFERLNAEGRKLSPQQIRVAIYHGFVVDSLHTLNGHESWRTIYGKKSKVLKDEELILRFLALYHFASDYKQPMKEFLNESTEKFIANGPEEIKKSENLFRETINYIHDAIGSKAFKPDRAINAAVYDSVMVGTASRLQSQSHPSQSDYKRKYKSLLEDSEYLGLVAKATANLPNVKRRLELATLAFRDLEPEQ